jgi:hypothetical protein
LFTFREAGTQVSPVTVSPLSKNHCSTLFTTGYKRLAEGGCEAFAFVFGFLLWAFAFLTFGFLKGKAFWMKGNCWREIAEGGK